MSICLITPPSIILSKERTFPHLGIMRIGAVLKERMIETSALDLCGVEDYIGASTSYLKQSEEKAFGITATSPQIPASVEIAKVIRAIRPDARIILGGSHVTSVNAGLKQEKQRGGLGRSHRALIQLSEIFDVAGSPQPRNQVCRCRQRYLRSVFEKV
jgi:anaerobic magnesium-protoporphyrin IX monomethyl ester cyclase